MNDKPLYDLLAKAELHPNSLTHLERLIWWPYEFAKSDEEMKFFQAVAAELEQYQQAKEVQRDKEWLAGEPVPAPVVDMFVPIPDSKDDYMT